MKEMLNNSEPENVIARSVSGRTLEVVKPGEKRELSAEKKAEIPEKIKEAKEKYENKIKAVEERYDKSGKQVIDEKIKKLGLQRAKEELDSRVNFLNRLM